MEDIEIHIELTNKCILKCKHCSSRANTISKQIDRKKIIEFIKYISLDKRVRLIFTGGEPLISEELEKILIEIHELGRNIDIGLFTTGLIEENNKLQSITSTKIRKLKSLGLKFVYLSIYSNNNSAHNYITQKDFSFENTVNSMEKLIKEGIKTNVNLVLMKQNINNINDIIIFLKNIGVNEIRILRLINQGRAKENWNEIGVSKDEQLKALKKIQLDEKVTLGGFLELKSCQYLTDNKECLAGKNKLYVDVKGDIYPCGSVKSNSNSKICNLENYADIVSYKKNKFLCMAY